ncbi:LysM peptidoglycan-binding domain-containing protein [Adhaeribacter pallidiroseus]|uniref:Membrane-bound lytic murein transglycosylase D n=1 Tax=Adhaeribacter pallidiroseus TaxID=2072847 RepID=A0A369QN21_9BACT|nr:LysM peptidoglycan-binding domain-containing protein [Adhaeribacter pallidiroseus]RDC64657.1 Membrane-bound lytic murein transglycosylase D [Adhaeribacter pallidiroseus]
MRINLFTLSLILTGLLFSLTSKANFLKKEQKRGIPTDTLYPTALTDTVRLADTTRLEEILGFALPDSVPMVTNELILDRLSCLQKEIPLQFNPYVRGFVDYFTIRNRKYSRRILSRENVYFPLFERYLAKYNLPVELKYLAVVESALMPRAVSHAAAVGLWQFIPSAASDYKLKINAYIDERMDPEKATDAACRYLRNLHRMFGGNWELALAAYNCGPGNVRKAIKRAGGQADFWAIFPYLPKETRGYVPSLTAIIYTMNHAVEHEIQADTLLYATLTDTIVVNHSLDLKKLSQQLSLDPDELPKLNPEVKKAILPATIRSYALKVPATHKNQLVANRTSILDSCKLPGVVTPSYQNIALAQKSASLPITTTSSTSDSADTDSLQQKEYIVAVGDNLSRIAQKNNVTIAQLLSWNNLNSDDKLFARQKLVLFTPASSNNLLANNTTSAEPEVKIQLASFRKSSGKKTLPKVKKTHTVQPNDTLWSISRRYNDIPVEKIKKLNKLKNNSLRPGMKLVIS